MKKRILIVCGTGIATSTVVAQRVRELLVRNGIEAELKQCLTSEVLWEAQSADLIVATTQIPAAVKIPTVNGVPFLTGIGVDLTEVEIIANLKA